eukprot:758919_1
MCGDARNYLDDILSYIASVQKTPHSLSKITLQSETQTEPKESSTLKKIVKKRQRVYRKHRWEIDYAITPDFRHTLIFTKHRVRDRINKKEAPTMKSMLPLLGKLYKTAIAHEEVDWSAHENDELQSFAMFVKQLKRDETGDEINMHDEVLVATSVLSKLGNLQ